MAESGSLGCGHLEDSCLPGGPGSAFLGPSSLALIVSGFCSAGIERVESSLDSHAPG